MTRPQLSQLQTRSSPHLAHVTSEILLSVALVALDLSKADKDDVAVSDTVYSVGDHILAVQQADHAWCCAQCALAVLFCLDFIGSAGMK